MARSTLSRLRRLMSLGRRDSKNVEVAESGSVVDLRVLAGHATVVLRPERVAALDSLTEELRRAGHHAELEIVERIPGRYGLPFAEIVSIYVGAPAAATLVAKATGDVYDVAKRWARARWLEKQSPESVNPRPEIMNLYGPNNEVLRSIRIDRNGEQED